MEKTCIICDYWEITSILNNIFNYNSKIMDSNLQSLKSENKSPFKKAAEKLVNSVIEKTENSNFQNTELENLLKIATAVAKTVPDLLNLAGGENSELAEGKSIFLAYIRQNIINDKRAMKSAKSLLKYCAEKDIKN